MTATATGYVTTSQPLTVTDDDTPPVQDLPDLTLSAVPSNLREGAPGRGVEVTATLPEGTELAEGVTVVVMLSHSISGDEATPTEVTISDPIRIVGPAITGKTTVTINPSSDLIFTTRSVELTGSATSYDPGTVSIGISDDDASVGTLTIVPTPPSVDQDDRDQEVEVKVYAVSGG